MWRWWCWGDDKIQPNTCQEGPLPPILGTFHPVVHLDVEHSTSSADAEGDQLAPRALEPQDEQHYRAQQQAKSSSEAEALSPPAASQGAC